LGTYNNHPPYLHVQKFFFLFLSLLYFHLYIFLFADPVNLLDTAHQNPTNWLAKKKKKIQRASRVSQCHSRYRYPEKNQQVTSVQGPGREHFTNQEKFLASTLNFLAGLGAATSICRILEHWWARGRTVEGGDGGEVADGLPTSGLASPVHSWPA
jgi:hypothetical protein